MACVAAPFAGAAAPFAGEFAPLSLWFVVSRELYWTILLVSVVDLWGVGFVKSFESSGGFVGLKK